MPHPERCPPQPGTPATPAGGWRRQPLPWRPQPLPPTQRPVKGSKEAREAGRKEKKREGAAKADWREAPPATGVERGGVRPGSSGRAENSGAEAALPSGMRREGSRAPLGGGRRGGAEPRLQAAAARSCGSPPHHLPPRRGLPAQPPAATGPVLRDEQKRARGLTAADSSRHAPAGKAPEGGGGDGGARVRKGQANRWPPPGPKESCAAEGQGPEKRRESEESGCEFPTSRWPPAARRASSSHPPEGSCEGGGGSAHAARSFRRRRRRCPNRGRPREKEAK